MDWITALQIILILTSSVDSDVSLDHFVANLTIAYRLKVDAAKAQFPQLKTPGNFMNMNDVKNSFANIRRYTASDVQVTSSKYGWSVFTPKNPQDDSTTITVIECVFLITGVNVAYIRVTYTDQHQIQLLHPETGALLQFSSASNLSVYGLPPFHATALLIEFFPVEGQTIQTETIVIGLVCVFEVGLIQAATPMAPIATQTSVVTDAINIDDNRHRQVTTSADESVGVNSTEGSGGTVTESPSIQQTTTEYKVQKITRTAPSKGTGTTNCQQESNPNVVLTDGDDGSSFAYLDIQKIFVDKVSVIEAIQVDGVTSAAIAFLGPMKEILAGPYEIKGQVPLQGVPALAVSWINVIVPPNSDQTAIAVNVTYLVCFEEGIAVDIPPMDTTSGTDLGAIVKTTRHSIVHNCVKYRLMQNSTFLENPRSDVNITSYIRIPLSIAQDPVLKSVIVKGLNVGFMIVSWVDTYHNILSDPATGQTMTYSQLVDDSGTVAMYFLRVTLSTSRIKITVGPRSSVGGLPSITKMNFLACYPKSPPWGGFTNPSLTYQATNSQSFAPQPAFNNITTIQPLATKQPTVVTDASVTQSHFATTIQSITQISRLQGTDVQTFTSSFDSTTVNCNEHGGLLGTGTYPTNFEQGTTHTTHKPFKSQSESHKSIAATKSPTYTTVMSLPGHVCLNQVPLFGIYAMWILDVTVSANHKKPLDFINPGSGSGITFYSKEPQAIIFTLAYSAIISYFKVLSSNLNYFNITYHNELGDFLAHQLSSFGLNPMVTGLSDIYVSSIILTLLSTQDELPPADVSVDMGACVLYSALSSTT
ncbi:unnamed protein product, partial [Didymodactylos carnosus]